MKEQNEVLAILGAWGVPMKETMERFLDDGGFYMECLQDFMQDGNLAALDAALQAKDYQAAFDASHTLKGVAGNLGLKPLFDAVVEIVEPLRNKDYSNLDAQYHHIVDVMNELKEKIGA